MPVGQGTAATPCTLALVIPLLICGFDRWSKAAGTFVPLKRAPTWQAARIVNYRSTDGSRRMTLSESTSPLLLPPQTQLTALVMSIIAVPQIVPSSYSRSRPARRRKPRAQRSPAHPKSLACQHSQPLQLSPKHQQRRLMTCTTRVSSPSRLLKHPRAPRSLPSRKPEAARRRRTTRSRSGVRWIRKATMYNSLKCPNRSKRHGEGRD